MISDYFTTTFTTGRQEWSVDDDSNAFSTQQPQGTFLGHLQQGNIELAQSLGLAFTKTFRIWCPEGTDVKEGDELTAGGYSYFVRAKKVLLVGNNKHIELGVERELVLSA